MAPAQGSAGTAPDGGSGSAAGSGAAGAGSPGTSPGDGNGADTGATGGSASQSAGSAAPGTQDNAPTAPGSTAPGSPAAAAAQVAPRTYRVDPAGGPLTLSERLAAMAAAWRKAAPDDAVVNEAQDAPALMTYGDAALLGPDVLSLSRRSSATGLRIELAPAAVDDDAVLLHALGVVLGLPEGGDGVMAFGVPAGGGPGAPTPADVDALRATRRYAPEDLTHDGVVDFYDLVAFGQAYGVQGVNVPADFNHDGRVDDADLAALRSAYTFGPPSPTAPTAGSADGSKGPGASGAASPASDTGSAGGAPSAGGSTGSGPAGNGPAGNGPAGDGSTGNGTSGNAGTDTGGSSGNGTAPPGTP